MNNSADTLLLIPHTVNELEWSYKRLSNSGASNEILNQVEEAIILGKNISGKVNYFKDSDSYMNEITNKFGIGFLLDNSKEIEQSKKHFLELFKKEEKIYKSDIKKFFNIIGENIYNWY